MSAEEQVTRRARKTMIAGSILNFAIPPVIGLVVFMAVQFFGPSVLSSSSWGWVLPPLLIPLFNGGLVAFLGTTLADRQQGVMEWGFVRPAKCLLYGLAPYLLLGVLMPGLSTWKVVPMVVVPALALAVTGGSLTAWLLKRSARSRARSGADLS